MSDSSPTARYLLRFKYVSPRKMGLCRELEALTWRIQNGGRDWMPEGVSAKKGPSDPTANAALGAMAALPELVERRDAIEAEIGHVGTILAMTEGGELLSAYYLSDEPVTWAEVAAEFGLPMRTLHDTRKRALDALDKNKLLVR
jgi:hypothetical protein